MTHSRLRASGAVLSIAIVVIGCGGRRPERPPQAARFAGRSPSGVGEAGRAELSARIIDGWEKPVMGRAESLSDMRRVVTRVAPLVEEASMQPGVAGGLASMASTDGVGAEEERRRWVHMLEADILVESGGDPDALSSAGAAGVAQWMPRTAIRIGLPVNLAESDRLTRILKPLQWRAAWLAYDIRPDRGPIPAGAPQVSVAAANRELPALREHIAVLRAKRAGLDARYDPRQAIFAQARYLIGLHDRYPSLDWLFQAYHGGTDGVDRLIRLYTGPSWPGSSVAAIRTAGPAGRLSYEDVFFTCDPITHPAAFRYLYGRGDDHRFYWWKLRAAEQAIDLYRENPEEFRRKWLALAPGRNIDSCWYPAGGNLSLRAGPAIDAGLAHGTLVDAVGSGIVPADGGPRVALRPGAAAALALVARTFREYGGSDPLTVRGALSLAEIERRRRAFPQKPALPDPPLPDLPPRMRPSIDTHATGLVFDLLPPRDPTQRKILEYALDTLRDRGAIWYYRETSPGDTAPHYHVVPKPGDR
ncbi:MAG: transglycosylase SLT domain-containing protein [Capsulimonadaceae bacterium]